MATHRAARTPAPAKRGAQFRDRDRDRDRETALGHGRRRARGSRLADLGYSILGTAALAIAAVGAVQADETAVVADRSSLASGVVPGLVDVTAPRREPILSRSARRVDRHAASAAVDKLAGRRSAALAALEKLATQRSRDLRAEARANRWVLPVASYRLTGRFGDSSYLWSTVHTGLDFAAPEGSTLMAVAAGVVTSAGYDDSYGNRTVIELPDGTELWYCHQSSITVSVGVRSHQGNRSAPSAPRAT